MLKLIIGLLIVVIFVQFIAIVLLSNRVTKLENRRSPRDIVVGKKRFKGWG